MQYIRSLVLSCLLVGCVSEVDYNRLKVRHEHVQQQLADRQERIGALSASVTDAEALANGLRLQRDETIAKLSQTEQKLTHVDDQLKKSVSDQAQLTASNLELTAALTDLKQRDIEAVSYSDEFNTLLTHLERFVAAGTLRVTRGKTQLLLELPADNLFDAGSAALSGAGKQAIAELAAILSAGPAGHYQVIGHTDNAPLAQTPYASSWELAGARSISVLNAMLAQGMPAAWLSAATFGDVQPAASNDNPEGQRSNRRIQISVVQAPAAPAPTRPIGQPEQHASQTTP